MIQRVMEYLGLAALTDGLRRRRRGGISVSHRSRSSHARCQRQAAERRRVRDASNAQRALCVECGNRIPPTLLKQKLGPLGRKIGPSTTRGIGGCARKAGAA